MRKRPMVARVVVALMVWRTAGLFWAPLGWLRFSACHRVLFLVTWVTKLCIDTLCKVCISLAWPLSCSPVGNGVGVPLHTPPHSGINYIILGSAVGGSALFLICLILLCVICVCLCCCCRGRRSKRARRKKKTEQQVARGFPNRLCDDGNIHAAPVSPPGDVGYPVLQPTHSMSSVAYPQLQPAYSLGTFSTLGEPPAYSGLVSLVEGEEEA